jgi:amino acid adenylation domain-containing protein
MNREEDISLIGSAFPSAIVVVIDDFGNVAPHFARGEICIGGRQLFTCYLGNQSLTDESHLIHENYGRLYKTGDIGFCNNRGEIVFCGRRDFQIKLHGRRIELNHISSVISKVPSVQQSAVLKIEEQIVAFLVLDTDDDDVPARDETNKIIPLDQDDVQRIRLYLQREAIVEPSRWMRVSRLPLTISGKLNQHALRLLFEIRGNDDEIGKFSASRASENQPQGDCESQVLEICVDVLGESIGMTANMLDHGLDSYAGMNLLSRLRWTFSSLHMTLHDLMHNASPRALAKTVQSCIKDAAVLPPAEEGQDETPTHISFHSGLHPTSSMQKRFCLAQEVFQDATYNVPALIEMPDSPLHIISAILNAMVQEHAIFRTHFTFNPSGIYHQQIEPHVQLRIDEHDNRDANPEGDYMRQIRARLRSASARVFDITSIPLLESILFHIPGKKCLVYLNFHHSIMDEQSLRLFLVAFTSKVQGSSTMAHKTTTQTPELRDYLRYCVVEKENLSNVKVVSSALDFWKNHLQRMSSIVFPPISHAQLKESGVKSFTRHISIPKIGMALARLKGLTNFSTYLMHVFILLARCLQCSTPAILIPVSQRPPDSETLYGCFLNTVPLCFHVEESVSIETVMQSFNRAVHEAMEKSFIPFEMILEAVGTDAREFPVMFVYHENNCTSEWLFVDRSDEVRQLANHAQPKFPITLSVTVTPMETTHEIDVNVDFDAKQFSLELIEGLCNQYAGLLMSTAGARSGTKLEELTLNGESEQQIENPDQPRGTPEDCVGPSTLTQSIMQQAANHPERRALWVEADASFTYKELTCMALNIAQALAIHRVRDDDCVAIFMDASLERVASILGVLMAGFAYVPLDIEWPPLRLAAVLEDAAPKFILVAKSLAQSLLLPLYNGPSNFVRNVTIIRFEDIEMQTTSGQRLPLPEVNTSHLAYILYTSGSTGAPKGVMMEHGAVINSVREHGRIYKLSSASRLLQFAPWTFDVSVADILATLSFGSTLCIGSKDYLLSRLEEAIDKMKITHIATTPTVATLLDPEKTPSLKTLAIGGEPMTEAVRRKWAKGQCLLNVYGPTEACVNIAYCCVQPDSDIRVVGQPMRSVDVHILDHNLRKVPIGFAGELAIGGTQLARGYTNTETNDGNFIQHPSLGRLFMTGDYDFRLPNDDTNRHR